MDRRNTHKILMRKPERKTQCARLRIVLEGSAKMNLEEEGREGGREGGGRGVDSFGSG